MGLRGMRAATALAIFVAACNAAAQDVPPVEISVPAGMEIRRVAPGGITTLALDVTNRTGQPREVVLGNLGGYSTEGWTNYRFSTAGGCAVEQPTPSRVIVRVGTLAPAQTRRCELSIERGAGASPDLILSFLADARSPASGQIFVGTVVDRSVEVALAAPVATYDREATVRLTVRNLDASAAAPAMVRGCFQAAEGLRIDSDLPGGCASTAVEVCPPPAPPIGPSFRVAFPGLAPGATISCLLRLRTEQPIATSVRVVEAGLVDATTSTDVFVPFVDVADPNDANDHASVLLGSGLQGISPTITFVVASGQLSAIATEVHGSACRTMPFAVPVVQRVGTNITIDSPTPGPCPEITGPPTQSTLTAALGALPPGTYSVTWRFGNVQVLSGTLDTAGVGQTLPAAVPATDSRGATFLAVMIVLLAMVGLRRRPG